MKCCEEMMSRIAVEHSIRKSWKRDITHALGLFIKNNCFLPANASEMHHCGKLWVIGDPGIFHLKIRSSRLFHKTEHELEITYHA